MKAVVRTGHPVRKDGERDHKYKGKYKKVAVFVEKEESGGSGKWNEIHQTVVCPAEYIQKKTARSYSGRNREYTLYCKLSAGVCRSFCHSYKEDRQHYPRPLSDMEHLTDEVSGAKLCCQNQAPASGAGDIFYFSLGIIQSAESGNGHNDWNSAENIDDPPRGRLETRRSRERKVSDYQHDAAASYIRQRTEHDARKDGGNNDLQERMIKEYRNKKLGSRAETGKSHSHFKPAAERWYIHHKRRSKKSECQNQYVCVRYPEKSPRDHYGQHCRQQNNGAVDGRNHSHK